MSAEVGCAGLPAADRHRHSHPKVALLHHGRGAVAAVARRIYDVEIHGVEHVPVSGPVIVAANHISFIDGPLLSILGPRPVHSLTKVEMFHGPVGAFLHATGQIPVSRHEADIAAVRISLEVLRAGGVLGVYPEATRGPGDLSHFRRGAAYFAMVTGAPVVPLIYLGTRPAGSPISSLPRPRSRMAMTFGPPLEVAARPWPRRSAEVAELTEQIRNAMLDTLRSAEDVTGLSLPGPAPDGEVEE